MSVKNGSLDDTITAIDALSVDDLDKEIAALEQRLATLNVLRKARSRVAKTERKPRKPRTPKLAEAARPAESPE